MKNYIASFPVSSGLLPTAWFPDMKNEREGDMTNEMDADIEMMMDDGGFMQNEAICLYHITQAWNRYATLPVQHESERTDFLISIHRLQDLMAMRVSRREHPRMWPLQIKTE